MEPAAGQARNIEMRPKLRLSACLNAWIILYRRNSLPYWTAGSKELNSANKNQRRWPAIEIIRTRIWVRIVTSSAINLTSNRYYSYNPREILHFMADYAE